MNTNRILIIANLFGCLAISGIILVQWLRESGLAYQLRTTTARLEAVFEEKETERKRAGGLENDVAQLKESIESMAKSRAETEEAIEKLVAEQEARAADSVNASQAGQEQAKAWEQALAERDQKIRELNESLVSTRRKLDEAVEKLKAAGAR